jgi:hypothetical protein
LNRVYACCHRLLKERLPKALSRFDCLVVVLSVPFTVVKYLRLNRGIRFDDVKMINWPNVRRLSMKQIDIYKES